MNTITQTVYVKHEFTQAEKLDIANKMAWAENAISEKMDNLKSYTQTIKGEIAIQEEISHNCAGKLRSGYEMVPREATPKYESGVVKLVDCETGEVLEERPMTKDEQLRLSNSLNADDVIKEIEKEFDDSEQDDE